MKKIALLITKVCVFAVLLYSLVGFLILPWGLKWALQEQASKMLNHPLHVHSVRFNPFLFTLYIGGLEILDKNKTPIVGFDSLQTDVSFLQVFKKVYQVEYFRLDGLKLNVILLADHKINLQELVPQQKPAASKDSQPAAHAPVVDKNAPPELPLVVVETIEIKNAEVRFRDESLDPAFVTELSDIDITITGFSTAPDLETKMVLTANLDKKGKIENEVTIKPFVQPLELQTTFSLSNYGLEVISPYTGKYAGHKVKDGQLSVHLDYTIHDNQLSAQHKLLVKEFDFGEKVQSKDALNLPFGLAVALLEDASHQIKLALPAKGDMSHPEFDYWQLVSGVFKNFFLTLMTKPFTFLTSFLPEEEASEELGIVLYEPGASEFSDDEKKKIDVLIAGLKERPKLTLQINGAYVQALDWKAIAAQTFENDFAVLKSESTKGENWVYQQLYQRRFGVKSLWDLVNKYQKAKIIDYAALNQEIKTQLIEGSNADQIALKALASQRAQNLYNYISSSGIEFNRIQLGANRAVDARGRLIPLEFALNVLQGQ